MGSRHNGWLSQLTIAVLLWFTAFACAPLPSKGTMPPPGPNGVEDASAMPDFIAVAGRAEAWVAVLLDGSAGDGTGFWGLNLGAGCYAMPRGSRLVLFDRDPREAGAGVVRQLYVRGQEPDPPSLWIRIGRDGTIEQGTGVPAWWGDPQTC
jgi:hypothetical protein